MSSPQLSGKPICSDKVRLQTCRHCLIKKCFLPRCAASALSAEERICVWKNVFQMFLGIQETTNAALPDQNKLSPSGCRYITRFWNTNSALQQFCRWLTFFFLKSFQDTSWAEKTRYLANIQRFKVFAHPFIGARYNIWFTGCADYYMKWVWSFYSWLIVIKQSTISTKLKFQQVWFFFPLRVFLVCNTERVQ